MDIATVCQVPLSDIKLEGINVRSDIDSEQSQEGIKELAENIRINGLLQPIVLEGINGHPPYDVIVGQRRFKAHQYLGANYILATFSGNIDPIQALVYSLSENMCRQEMNYADTSRAITQLYNHFDKDERAVQQHTGFSIRQIRSYIKIEDKATDKIKSLLAEHKISMADAKRAIDAAQGDDQKADALIDQLVSLTKHEKKRLVDSGIHNPNAPVDELIRAAKKPRIEETIILNLPLKVHNALRIAAEKMSLDMEVVTLDALTEWLKTNDFLND